jgi:hypothetical protein
MAMDFGGKVENPTKVPLSLHHDGGGMWRRQRIPLNIEASATLSHHQSMLQECMGKLFPWIQDQDLCWLITVIASITPSIWKPVPFTFEDSKESTRGVYLSICGDLWGVTTEGCSRSISWSSSTTLQDAADGEPYEMALGTSSHNPQSKGPSQSETQYHGINGLIDGQLRMSPSSLSSFIQLTALVVKCSFDR